MVERTLPGDQKSKNRLFSICSPEFAQQKHLVCFLFPIFELCGLFFPSITQTICGCYISYSLLDTLFFFQPTQVIDDENVTNLDEDKYFVKLMRQWNDSFYK